MNKIIIEEEEDEVNDYFRDVKERGRARYVVLIHHNGTLLDQSFKTNSLEFGLQVIVSEARNYVGHIKRSGKVGYYILSVIDTEEADLTKRILSSEVL
jgi:hypothetical protein